MKFFEAVEIARKTGKAIKNGNEVASWKYSTDALHWESTGAFVLIDGVKIDADWQVIEPPPEYSFAEAFAMMKQGKWMKPNGSMDCRTQADGQPHGKWLVRQVGCLAAYQFDCFPVAFIESKWTEAKD